MNKFNFSYPTKVYFGEGSAAQVLDAELAMVCDWLFRAVVFSIRWLSGKWKTYRVV